MKFPKPGELGRISLWSVWKSARGSTEKPMNKCIDHEVHVSVRDKVQNYEWDNIWNAVWVPVVDLILYNQNYKK